MFIYSVHCVHCICITWSTQKLEQDLQLRVQENTELHQQLQSSEKEKQILSQRLTAELTRSEETVKREQQQQQEVTLEGGGDMNVVMCPEHCEHDYACAG